MDAFERNRRRLEENQRRLDALRMQNNKPASTERPKQSFFNKVRDQFDANTASDQYRRQQAGDARLYSRQQKDRGIGRVANNPWERTLNLGKSIGESVYATPKRLGQAVEEVVNGNKTQQSFNQLNQTNQKVLNKVNARLANPNLTPAERSIQEDIRQKMIRLQRQGYDDQRKEFGVAADKLDPKKNAAAVADAALTIASAGAAGVAMKTAGQTAAKLGYRAAARQAAPAFFKNMGLNTAQSVTDTVANIGEGRQAGWKDIAKGGVVGATVGSVADVGLGLIPGVIGKRQYDKLLKDLASETDAGIVKQTVAAVNKNLPDEAVDNLSNDIAKAGTPDEVNKLLNEAADAEASVATKAVGNTVDNPTAPKPETPAIPNTAVTPEIVQGFKQAKTPQQARDAVKALFPELDETTANKVIQDISKARDDKTITQILEQAQTRRTAVTQGVQDVTPQAEAIAPTPEQQLAKQAEANPNAPIMGKQAVDPDIQANQVTAPEGAVAQNTTVPGATTAQNIPQVVELRERNQLLQRAWENTTDKAQRNYLSKQIADNNAEIRGVLLQADQLPTQSPVPTQPELIQNLPGSSQGIISRIKNRFTPLNEGGYVQLPGGKNVDPLESLKQEARDIKTRTIKTADGKTEYVAQLGDKVTDRTGRETGFKATTTSPNFKSEGEMQKWISQNIDSQATQPPKSTAVQPDPLESLKQEARKYKSAEEFVKAQGEPLYHGTSAQFDKFDPTRAGTIKTSDWGKGTYFDATPDGADYYRKQALRQTDTAYKQAADRFMKASNGGEITTPETQALLQKMREAGQAIDSGTSGRVIEARLKPGAKVLDYEPTGYGVDQSLSETAAKQGYDAVRITDGNGKTDEMLVINPDAVYTKRQLTDLYNQATKAPVEGKVGQVVAPEVPTQTTRAVADANPEIVVPESVTNAESLSGQFQKQAADKDANYINYLKKVEKQTGQTGLVDQFYYDSGLQRRSNSIANSTANNSENLTGAFQGLTGKSKQEFDRYVELRNEIANANRGLKTAEKLDSLVAQEQALAGTYGTRFESLNNYYKEWATKLREGGLIDEPTYQSFIQNNDYTHIQRVMDDIANYSGGTGGNAMTIGQTKARLKRTGSERAIQPADITALNYGQIMQSEIQRNQTASDMIDVLVGQGHAKQVPADQAARKNTIRRIVDGKTEIYQVPRDIKEIADNITPFQLGTLGKIVAAPQRVIRAGATGLSAPFTAANYVKDQVGSAVFSKNVAATHLDPRNALSGLWNATRDTLGESNNPLWKKFIESSGDTTGYDFLRNAKDAKRMSREVRLGKKGKYANMVTAPIRTLEELNAITEKATRFQNFKGVYESALKKTGNEADALREATLAAWQNSVDFSRMGSTAQAINLLIPYFNAGIQGTRLLGRRFGEAPVGTTMKTLGFVALPMAGLTLYNLSDEKRKAVYDNISDYEKENNLIIVLPNAEQKPDGSYDGVIKVPLQQGLTNLAQPFRMQAENFAGKSTPNEVAQMAQQFFGAFAGPIGTGSLREAAGSAIPQVVKPFVQQGMNKDLFTGKEIVPDYINNATDAQGNAVPNKDKAYEFTSGTARAIGGKLGVSPLRVEKFIKDVTAKTGLYALNATDNALAKLGKIPEEQIGGISVKDDIIRRFARAQGTYNYKKSEGGKYYDRVKDATKSLNGNEKAAWDSIHPSKTNFLGEDIFDENKRLAKYTKAGLYLQHPKVFEAERAIEMEQRKQGSPANPLYDLPKEQLAKVLLKDALPPGAKDDELSNLFKQEWYQDFKNKQSAYYTQLKQKLEASGKTMPVSDNPYPVTSPELQKHMDYYSSLPKGTGARSSFIKGNPKIWASMTSQWQATDDWENKERVKIGLNPITDDQSSGSSSGGKFGYSNGGGSGGKGKKEATPKTYIGQLLGDVPSVSSNEINIKTTPKRAKLKVKTPSGKGRNYKKIKLG